MYVDKTWGAPIATIDLNGVRFDGDPGVNGRIVQPLIVGLYISANGHYCAAISNEFNEDMPYTFFVQQHGSDPTWLIRETAKDFLTHAYFFREHASTFGVKSEPTVNVTDAGRTIAEFLNSKTEGLNVCTDHLSKTFGTTRLTYSYVDPTLLKPAPEQSKTFVGNLSERL